MLHLLPHMHVHYMYRHLFMMCTWCGVCSTVVTVCRLWEWCGHYNWPAGHHSAHTSHWHHYHWPDPTNPWWKKRKKRKKRKRSISGQTHSLVSQWLFYTCSHRAGCDEYCTCSSCTGSQEPGQQVWEDSTEYLWPAWQKIQVSWQEGEVRGQRAGGRRAWERGCTEEKDVKQRTFWQSNTYTILNCFCMTLYEFLYRWLKKIFTRVRQANLNSQAGRDQKFYVLTCNLRCLILLYTLCVIIYCTCEVWLIAMSQCSSYRMDSVPCTVPAAQLRTYEHKFVYDVWIFVQMLKIFSLVFIICGKPIWIHKREGNMLTSNLRCLVYKLLYTLLLLWVNVLPTEWTVSLAQSL